MKVFIVCFGHECMREIIGVYDTREKANAVCENFMKNISSAGGCHTDIIERNVE